jgi:diacylglycerol O-acyltransferase / wax synthase
MSRGIPPLDLMFLLAERNTQPSHVGALMLFRPPARARRDYVARLVARYRAIPPTAPFNLVPSIPFVGQPVWRKAAELDMRYHVRHLSLPAPGSETQLWDLVQDLHGVTLNRDYPLFRIFFIEGLASGEFALFSKIHHSIIDGVSGLARTAAALNDAPDPERVRAIYGVEGPARKRRDPQAGQVAALLRAATTGANQARALGDLASFLLRRAGDLLLKPADGHGPQGSRLFSSARLPTNLPFRAGRSFAAFEVTASTIEGIRRSLGGTMNDVAMTIVDLGLSRYLAARQAAPTAPIVCMCPVDLRDAGDAEASTKVSAVFVPMGEPGEGPVKRLARISANAAAAKKEMRSLSATAALDLAVGLYAAQEGAIALGMNALPPTANLVLSNLRASATTAYLGDARLRAFYPVSMIGGGIGLNVTFVSYDGRLDFGLVANQAAIPDAERLARECRRALGDLTRAAARRRRRKS